VKIPPYNGFGDEEDSLSNVNKLLAKAPKKDYFKWVDNQIQLRFNALMVTNKPEDVGRRFIITLYMNDDTVMVYEPQVRNSGIVSGKFLEKMKYKNKLAGGRFFLPEDFLISKTVQINAYKFLVQDQDERTKQWLEQNIGTANASQAPAQNNPYSMPARQQNGGQQDHIQDSQAWDNFQSQPPVHDGKGWEQGQGEGQNADFVNDYYGSSNPGQVPQNGQPRR
jgi:hypothetical protein